MINNRVAKYLWDARRAAERIVKFTSDRTYNEYLDDEMLSAAVERQFEIIGEALSRVRRVAPELSAQIPDISDIIGFRNTLAHEYDGIDSQQVWGTIKDDLPNLISTLMELLKQAPPLD